MEAITNMVMDEWKNFWKTDSLNTLETELKRLSGRAFEFKQEVTKAEKIGKNKRKREVENWFEEFEQTENALKNMIQNGKNRIPDVGLWWNFFNGDSVAKLVAKVEQLMEQSQHFDGLLIDDHENKGEPRLTTTLFGDKFQEGLKTIWNWLLTDNLSNIGIYGQGGVGKTTLANHIHNHLLETTDSNVYWVTVSQDFSIKKLQDDIAKLVKLDLSGEDDEDRRAARLSMSLAHQQSVLILDDVWEEFCLENIGIAHGANKCRLILTTRSLQVCHRMHCEREFNVTTLDVDETWNLFKHTLGLKRILTADVEETAKSVARRCGGLPLGIITVARSMRGVVGIYEWRNALEQLKSSLVGYKEWSFNSLNGFEKHCFLYCCLYPEDSYIEREELINLFILAELIPRRKNRESEHDHGRTILNKLVKACLLEETQYPKCIKMHDLIRDMALRITGRNSTRDVKGDVPRFLVSGIEPNVIMEESEWTEDLNVVSFARPFFSYFDCSLEIPSDMSPKCKNLSTLLFKAVKIERIPDSFFRDMDGLKVLDLRECRRLKELPNSVSTLVNLTALLLGGCREIKLVPPLGKLKQLRELDLFETRIGEIPQGLELLVKLERLNLRECSDLKELPNSVSNLVNLTALLLRGCREIKSVPPLGKLKQLRELDLSHTDIYDIPQGLELLFKLERLNMGGTRLEKKTIPKGTFSRLIHLEHLRLERCNFKKGLDVNLLAKDIKKLILHNCFGFSDGNLRNLIRRSKDLVHLHISNSELEFLVNFSSPPPPLYDDNELVVLPNLNYLYLVDLSNLVGLINGGREQLIPPPPGTFYCLTELTISGCHRLKKLFTVQLLSQQHTLQNLEWLQIIDCEQLEEMIAGNDNDEGMGEETVIHLPSSSSSSSTVRLPKLRLLRLIHLPQLENKAINIISDSIQEIEVYRCPKLKRMPVYVPINSINTTNAGNGQTSSSSAPPSSTVREIKGSKEWWESLEWDHYPPNSKAALLPFFESVADDWDP